MNVINDTYTWGELYCNALEESPAIFDMEKCPLGNESCYASCEHIIEIGG